MRKSKFDSVEVQRIQQKVHLAEEILQRTEAVVVVADAHGRITYVSPATERILGYRAEELLGDGWWQRTGVDPAERQREKASVARIARGEAKPREMVYERLMRRRDGEVRYILWKDARGPANSVIGVGQDITERKETEEELRKVNQSLETLVNTAPAAIISIDNEGTVLTWNPEARRLFGWRAEEIVGRFLPILPPDKRGEYEGLREQLLQGEAAILETVRQRKDGSLIDVHLSLAPLRDARGNVWGSMGVLVDITERKREEQALRRSEEVNRAFAQTIPDMIFRLTKDGTYLDYKPGRGIRPYVPPTEFLGRNIAEVLPPDVAQLVLHKIQQALATGETQGLEYELVEEDGRHAYEGRVAPSGEKEVLTIVRDITTRKQAERELAEYAERYRQLLASLPVAAGVVQRGIIVFVNSADAALLGFERPEELIGRNGLAFVAEEDVPRLREYMEAREAGRPAPTRYECKAKRRDGTVLPVELLVTRIDYEGEPASLIVVLDLTERKRLHLFEAILPVCCMCGKVREQTGKDARQMKWRALEDYVAEHSNTDLSHTFCPECYRRYRKENELPPEDYPVSNR